MARIKWFTCFFVLLFTTEVFTQTTDITGKVVASNDVVGIHVINITALKYTITDDYGRFEIPVHLNDTITVSAVQYKTKDIVITDSILQAKTMTVYLEDKINELDEVVVGKMLTGDLLSDIENSDVKRDINFYDVGIPGYTGPRKTQSERRLYEANSGGGILPLNPLINWITGRTKRLKAQVKLEKRLKALDAVRSKYSEMLFENDTLDESLHLEFFYFASHDPNFVVYSNTKTEMAMLEFLHEKLKAFKIQIEDD
ncbi:carboxypeptidase-like regulatory domain-containing protein [uncultured Psychroserpens sp.]|uniref:carboxypeptidase-like regulatory domain-containing protein n=1 Tax=uncultured Psychroserpens sp. TaxID=255436 RepID=UPI00262FA6FD|nr:carboxypeptidase-like regulatory domain-containing protein [uncultured Psychroserpens sp.]